MSKSSVLGDLSLDAPHLPAAGTTFARGGNGGAERRLPIQLANLKPSPSPLVQPQEEPDDEPGYRVNLERLEEELERDRLDGISTEVGTLTYGEMFQLALEISTGKRAEQGDVEAKLEDTEIAALAAKLHKWTQARLPAVKRAEAAVV